MGRFHAILVTPTKTLAPVIRAAVRPMDDAILIVANSQRRARQVLETALFDLVIVDFAIEAGQGTEILTDIRKAYPGISILVITGERLREQDRAALRMGVDGFLIRPVRPEHAHFEIARVRELRRLREAQARLADKPRRQARNGIIGNSREMQRVHEMIDRSAETDVPVALYGESGTGKELVARAIHRASSRRAKPFIAVNAAAMPETLLESELFGHARGAFTGALGDREGYIEAAAGGTFFLDEIGDLPLALQGKLLRVLQERTIHRVGSTRPIQVDFRLVTATNHDLTEAVRAGRFREDLFYRVHVFPIYMPPLRARRDDIPLLAEHFLRRYATEMRRTSAGFSPAAMEVLAAHEWPGNVRELENLVHRVVAMKKDGSRIEPPDLHGLVQGAPIAPPPGVPAATTDVRPLEEHVRDYVRWAYEKVGRNKARAARLLEIDRATLYRKLRE